MSLMRWNPWEELSRLREEMQRLVEGSPFPAWLRGEFLPSVDVFEAGNEVVLKADLPGFDPKDVEVRVFPDSVVIKAQSQQAEEVERAGYYHRERRSGSIYRQVRLPAQVIPEDARASFRNGLLEVRMSKAGGKDANGYKVDIQAD